MSRADRIALVISLVTVLTALFIGENIFENLPHLEDEMAYIWQGTVIARGDLALTSPICPRCFLQPFVVDHNGLRFGKYPLGWPAMLALGIGLGMRAWINPLLAGLAVWLTYRLVNRVLEDEAAGIIAALLTAASPFFLMNAGSLLSHVWSFVLVLSLCLGWLDAVRPRDGIPPALPAVVAGLSLGALALTRPLTAVAVGLPFGIHGIYLLVRGNRDTRLRIIGIGLLAAVTASLHFLWQYAVTGDPLLNPYTLWWDYDRLGFGPGIGVLPEGHNLHQARINTRFSLQVGWSDLFGWSGYSWIFIPFGAWAARRKLSAWLIGSIAPLLVLAYLFYWVGSWLFGPRYYFEGIISCTLLTSAGIRWLAGQFGSLRDPKTRLAFFRFAAVTGLVAGLLAINTAFYLPNRLNSFRGYNGFTQERLAPFRTPEALELTPALVIVHMQQNWMEYGVLLELSSPYLNTPFVFTFSRGDDMDRSVAELFPERRVFHYYADTPWNLYEQSR